MPKLEPAPLGKHSGKVSLHLSHEIIHYAAELEKTGLFGNGLQETCETLVRDAVLAHIPHLIPPVDFDAEPLK